MRRWRPSIGRATTVGVALLAALLLAGVAYASWSRSATGGPLSVTTATLDAPTNLAAAHDPGCNRHVADAIDLSWTASTDAAVSGYEVFRSTTSGGPYSSIGTVSGRTTTAYVDGNLPFSTTYYYVVKASRATWRSGNSGQTTLTTLNSVCK